jgi:hypothetical protein
MRIRFTRLSLGLGAASVAATGAALAAEVVILNPGEIKGYAAFGGDAPVTGFGVSASSPDGFSASQSFTTNTYSLTVESGHDYRPQLQATFNDPEVSSSSLQVSRANAIKVNNQAGPTTVNFDYPTVLSVPYTIEVVGGTVATSHVYASASAATESYFAYGHEYFSSSQPSSASGRVMMVPDDQVSVYGTVYLTAADGTQIQRSLEPQSVNLTTGGQTVSWAIDLTNTGQLAGAIDLDPGPEAYSESVYFQGVYNTSSAGISGSRSVTADAYAIDLPPGEYDVFLRSYFSSPNGYLETKTRRVAVAAGAATTLDFVEGLGTAQAPLVIDGFFSNESLNSSQMMIEHVDPSTSRPGSAYTFSPVDGRFDFPVTAGNWRRNRIILGLYDQTDPQLPLQANVYHYHYSDADAPPTPVAAGATASLGTEQVTLVKSNAYLSVKEPAGAPAILLRSPHVYLYNHGYNPDGSLKTVTQSYAYGSSEPRETSGFTMVAPPGTYTMQAFATVNGSVTQFAGNSISFEPPVTTPTGDAVVITPVERDDLMITLTFDGVTSGGVTTVVETPLGPDPPEGLKMYCGNNPDLPQEIACPNVYYDIQSTAEASGLRVCVRRQHPGSPNGLDAFLGLYEYAPLDVPASDPTYPWLMLADQSIVNCGEEPAACGCATPEECGASEEVGVFMVCGLTTNASQARALASSATSSTSPGGLFTLFQREVEFTNVVNGVEYEGPTGPPSLQTWTAPSTGTYRITAVGARGASATQAEAQGIFGGCGAEIAGDFALNAGDTLQILVGQKGTATPLSAGGGGGSFVTHDNAPLLIAGGGGGVRSGATVNGRNGSTGTAGVAGSKVANYTSGFIAGGTNGSGGERSSSYGSGGGGWLLNGASDGSYGEGGFSFLLGAKGGLGKSCGGLAHGGYGGGGAGNGCYGGGGGGGYSGGGGGRVAGGGGSWNAGTHAAGLEGKCTNRGHGKVTIGLAH